MVRKIISFSAIMLFSVSVCTMTFAEEPSSETKNWEWNLAPFYLWAVSVDGDQTVGSNTGDIKVDFSDIIDKLEGAFIVNFQGVYQNRWGFIFDYTYLHLSDDDTNSVGINKDVDLKLNLAELDGFYRWNYLKHNFDGRIGLRLISMDATVKLEPVSREAGEVKQWVDPIVGLRWGWHFADQWGLKLSGDMGGFGLGSDFTWQAVGIIHWQPFKHASFFGGYRALYIDYDDGSKGSEDYYKLDATMHGPIVGVNFRW